MKGTIAILGCLLAAYAAPLFANEVPLILEETIQLPVIPDVWDVAKTGDTEYTFIYGVGRSDADHDSFSTYYWGNSVQSVLDSFLTGSGVGNGLGWPKYAEIYLSQSDSLQCLVMSQYSRECNLVTGVLTVACVDLTTMRGVAGFSRISYCDRPPWLPGVVCVCNYKAAVVAAVPSYPNVAQWYPGMYSYYATNAEGDHRPQKICSDLFGNGVCGAIDVNIVTASVSQWAGHYYYAALANDARIYRFEFEGDSLLTTTSWQSNEQSLAEASDLLCTWDEATQSAFVVLFVQDSLKAWSDTSATSLWSFRTLNRIALLADVVATIPGEELLVAEPQFELLHIRNPRDYSFWGQTSSFGAGYDEIKVISRYDGDYRRLVVRSGSELRIYRFGEPIYTDTDDARPELPNELTLSAYPNPFNPTTMIAFDLPKATRAKLVVFDLNGRRVQSLFDEQISAGHHEVGFDGAALPSGIYFARLSAGEVTRTHKLVLMK